MVMRQMLYPSARVVGLGPNVRSAARVRIPVFFVCPTPRIFLEAMGMRFQSTLFLRDKLRWLADAGARRLRRAWRRDLGK